MVASAPFRCPEPRRGRHLARTPHALTVVTYRHRPKRPPKKRVQAVAVPAIVSTRRKSGQFGAATDITPEEHQRRGDACEALFHELVRKATGAS